MVAFRVRPRPPRPPVHRAASLGLIGRQVTSGVCSLAAQGADLQAIGHQRTRGTVNLLALVGRQVTRGRLTPDILCLGRQATRGLCAVGGGSVTAWPNGYGYRALVEIAPQPDLSGTLANLVLRLPADVLAAPELRAAAGLDPGASSASRPFGAAAPWNVPAAYLPRDPNSDGLCALLWFGADATVGNCNVEYRDFSFPVYYAAAGTDPHATLPLANDAYTISCAGHAIDGTAIPWNSAWGIPSGSDAQVIVLDPPTGREWDLWKVSVNTAAKVVTCANGTVLADYRTGNGQNPPSRGIGIQYLAMLVRPWEVTQGRIDHAIPMGAINVSKSGGFVGPAIKTDGDIFGVDPGIPEGTRFVLDFTDAQRETWVATKPSAMRTAARVIANALREYGAVITDHSGGWHIQLEDRASAGAAWDALGLTDTTATRDLLDGLITRTNFHAVVPSPYPATGGVLRGFAGGLPADVRLEPYGAVVGASKLDHQFVRWAGSGALDLRVRLPSWDVTTPYRLWLYAGKAGLSATEENPTGLWQGAMRATRLDTGGDLSGGARALTPSGVTAGGTLAGLPAGRFVAASYCRTASPAYVPHLTAVTNEVVFQLDAAPGATDSGDLDRIGGTPLSAETHARYSSFVYQGGKISAGANWYDATTGKQTNEGVETAPGAVGAALVHCMAVRQSGQVTVIYVNGASAPVSTINPPVPSGPTIYLNVLANDEDVVGAGQGAQTTALPGLYALDVQWPAAAGAAFAAMRYRSEIEGRSVAGMGAFDAFGDTDQGPVAVPLRTTNAGLQTDYAVALGCFDPDTPPDPITLTAVGASTHAGDVTSLTGGKVRYLPQPGWPGGVAEVPFTIGDGRGKGSSSRLWLAVSPSLVVSGYYKAPNIAGKRKVAVTSRSELIAADATFAVGGSRSSATAYISIEGVIGTSDATKGSPINLVGVGTRTDPYVITSPGAGTDDWSGRVGSKVYNSRLVPQKAWTWLYGVWCSVIPTAVGVWNTSDNNPHCVTLEAPNCFVTACRLTGSNGVGNDTSKNADDAIICFNWTEKVYQAVSSTDGGDMCYAMSGAAGVLSKRWIIARNRSSDGPNANAIPIANHNTGSVNARFAYIGEGWNTTVNYYADWTVEYNFMDAGHSHYMEFKTGIKAARYNHGTGTGNVGSGIYYRGGNSDGGEISYNRLNCNLIHMDGTNCTMVSNWLVDGAGTPVGVVGLVPAAAKVGGGKGINGSDGLVMVGCKSARVIMPMLFEGTGAYTFGSLGGGGPVLIADQTGTFWTGGTTATDYATAKSAISFDGSGHPTGSIPHLTNGAITRQAAVPSGYAEQVPPVLSATLCGPGAPGLTWT